jgi:hypothetical protein
MARFVSVKDLSPSAFNQTLRARVLTKTAVAPSGSGCYVKVVLIDSTGKVPATFWDNLATQAASRLEEGNVYDFSCGKIQPAGKFATPEMPVLIDFRAPAPDPVPVPDPDSQFPNIQDQLVLRFSELSMRAKLSRVAIQGVVRSAYPVRTNWKGNVRDVSLVDTQGKTLRLTLWDSNVDLIDEELIGKSVRLHEISIRNPQQLEAASTAFTVRRPPL